MEWGAGLSLFHHDLLGGGYTLMCEHVIWVKRIFSVMCGGTPSHMAKAHVRDVYKVQDSGAYFLFGGGVRIILHMMV